jgi:methylase of polypeptide subunit release factors
MSAPPALSIDDPEGVGLFRSAMESAGYASDRVPELVGEPGLPAVSRLPMVLARLPDEGALSVLVRLLLLGMPVDRAEAEAALHPLPLARAVRMGLVSVEGRLVLAPVRILQFGGFAVAADAPEAAGMSADHVMAVSGSSMFLSNLTVRRPVGSALDVGTGTGIQALLASRHADRVVATDASARALSFARFNAMLNDVHNVEFREGNLFEPVAGERFDLVVSNPPFVVSPDAEFLYRDSPGSGDEISRDVVQGAAAHLAPGGTASILVGWIEVPDVAPWLRPTGWAPESGCDVWVLHHSSLPALAYAVQWNSHMSSDPDHYLGTVARWVAHYRAAGIGAVGYGAVVLRRRDGRNWRRFDDLGARYPRPSGDVLWSLIGVEDRMAEPPGAASFLDDRLAPEGRHVIEQALRQRDGTYEVERAELAQDDGLRFRVPADPLTAELLVRCDGQRTLREAIADLRTAIRFDGVTEEAFEESARETAVRMLRLGFLRLPE